VKQVVGTIELCLFKIRDERKGSFRFKGAKYDIERGEKEMLKRGIGKREIKE
jgi:hypothetical protein